jgi:septal ring factor EnvC (AmiA/AmiB activator)
MIHFLTKICLLVCLGVFLLLLSSCTQKQDPLLKMAQDLAADLKVYKEMLDAHNALFTETKALEKSLSSKLTDVQLAAYAEVSESWGNEAKNALAFRRLAPLMQAVNPDQEELADQITRVLKNLRLLHEQDAQLDAEWQGLRARATTLECLTTAADLARRE